MSTGKATEVPSTSGDQVTGDEFASDTELAQVKTPHRKQATTKDIFEQVSRSQAAKDGSTAKASQDMQALLGSRAPKGRITTSLFGKYKPSGATIKYSTNKIGILPNIDEVVMLIAEHAGLDLQDEDIMNSFLDCLVTDVYNNPYSDKMSFEGVSDAGGPVQLERYHIRDVIVPFVGKYNRRFARAMAPYITAVMHDNPSYYELLDKRCTEQNLNSRSEAIYAFDGADALPTVDRSTAERNAVAKALALPKPGDYQVYDISTSAAARGSGPPSS